MPGVAANVLPSPGALAWVAALTKSLYATVLLGTGGLTLFAAEAGASDRNVLILTVGGGIIYLLGRLGDWAVAFKKNWRAADAGTVQGELATVKEQLADAEATRDRHKTFAAEAIAGRQELHRQLTEANNLNRELMSDLREARREAAEARRDLAAATSRASEHANRTSDEVTQTNRLLAEKVAPRTPPAGPVVVTIDPKSEPVPVREVDGVVGGGADDANANANAGKGGAS
jgi:uncharacterized membrane protein